MKSISWQSRSHVLSDAIRSGHLPAQANGGNAYDFHAAMTLNRKFNLTVDESAVLKKSDSFRSYWWRMAHHNANADVIISEPSPIVFGKRNKKTKTVAMIHHIDDDLANSSLKHKWFFNRLKKRLSAVDLVVTVSRHWKEYLEKLNCNRIKIIYNSFEEKDYQNEKGDPDAFKKKFQLSHGKPIVYIGNAHRQKGVYEAYHALKDKDYQLVMTGATNHARDLPVKFLSLDRNDYVALLRASDVVVTLSKMVEGWNRIAHEAMLCKTPVIGSGTGGMQELLDGGGQLTVKDPDSLAGGIEKVLHNRKFYADRGYAYVKKFDNQYFESEWLKTIEELTKD